jgi:hypothetical protein
MHLDTDCTALYYTTLYRLTATPAIMHMSCIVCSAVASLELQLWYCDDVCHSALYCSRTCQSIDWKKQHKKFCKLVNVGHGGMQVRTYDHTELKIGVTEEFERDQPHNLDEDKQKRFFKLFQESTEEGSRAAAQKMKKYAKRQTKHNQKLLLFHSLYFLVHSDSEMLSWPNSPLLVMLQFVDPNVLSRDDRSALQEGEPRITPLHFLTGLADPFNYSTHENQLILAKQLIDHGANVNAVTSIRVHYSETPLHAACSLFNVTNLDFVELLLQAGANPNAQDDQGKVPLMYTSPDAPGAARFLLKWPSTDANITAQYGESFLAMVRSDAKELSDKVALPDNPDQIQDQFLLRQWREIEEMLVEKGAADTDVTSLKK